MNTKNRAPSREYLRRDIGLTAHNRPDVIRNHQKVNNRTTKWEERIATLVRIFAGAKKETAPAC